MVETPVSICSVCTKSFQPRFRYQVAERDGAYLYYCSQRCQQVDLGWSAPQSGADATSSAGFAGTGGRGLEPVDGGASAATASAVGTTAAATSKEQPHCDACGKAFALERPFQVAVTDRGPTYFCTMSCRQAAAAGAVRVTSAGARKSQGPRRIAVFNHKGGTGKTTTSVNLAAGLAEAGQRVLLVDADGQGNVGASLGIRGEHGLYHVLVHGTPVDRAAVPVRANLDVLTSNELLAAGELHLARLPNRDRVLRERLGDRAAGYDVVVIDCAPALSLMNQNALVYADSVIVPVSCDYLSLVGVKQVLKTLKNVREHLKHEVALLGVLPTFFDVRNSIARSCIESLEEHFGERCLTPIRVNTKLREAPSVRKTIFEHAPESHGALDYMALVDRVKAMRGDPRAMDHAAEFSPGRVEKAAALQASA
ncbi:MAG: ParA family protein [Sandaracinus sp.]